MNNKDVCSGFGIGINTADRKQSNADHCKEICVSYSVLRIEHLRIISVIISVNESYAGNCSKKGEAVTDDLDTTSKDVEADPNLAKKRKFMNHRNPMGSQCEFD
ncbi:hypothetical protein L195_g053114, partial [Trifolium pratense]